MGRFEGEKPKKVPGGWVPPFAIFTILMGATLDGWMGTTLLVPDSDATGIRAVSKCGSVNVTPFAPFMCTMGAHHLIGASP